MSGVDPARPASAPLHPVGVIHGRFQVLHLDHLKYLLAGKRLCEHLVVGVTNPDPSHTGACADPHRGRPEANPLTYYERQRMLRAAMEEAGVATAAFSVVPLPINFPELYRYYVPLDAVFYLTIYDAWGREKLHTFQDLGLRTQVLWEAPEKQKGIRGSQVRERMRRGEAWETLVPESVAGLMKRWAIPERLRAAGVGAENREGE